MATVRDIAERAGVSISTVSRVLNNNPQVSEAVRKKVLSVANERRYVPTIGKRSVNNIALVYTGGPSIASPYDAALMQGMDTAMAGDGYDLLVLDAQRAKDAGENYSQLFMRKGVAGAVLRTTESTRDVCLDIADEGFPAVVVGDLFDDPRVCCVDADSTQAVERAIEHLLHLGHRRIAITLNVVDDYDHNRRLTAYAETLSKAGVSFDERLVLRVPAYREAGAQSLRQIMSQPNRPTALFLTDSLAAVGLFHEAQQAGIQIPRDLSVIGFDDSDVRFGVYPKMSAVCQDTEALGREAMEMLAHVMTPETSSVVEPRATQCWLELHQSTAAPRENAAVT